MTESGAPSIPGFRIEGVLGKGATSTVFRATREDRSYAVKIFNFHGRSSTQEDLLRFRKEASTIAKLNHSGLVQLHEVGEIDGIPYLVMELVEGTSLGQRLEKGALSTDEVLNLALSLAATLEHFHCRGVVHKDLKPDNILIDSTGTVKVIDFGFAAEHSAEHAAHAGDARDDDNTVLGTLLYASPEQTGMLKVPVDNRSDLYSLGGVLYHCMTGRPVFQAANALALMTHHLTAKPEAPSSIRSDISKALSAITLKLLAKDPDDRYQSATGLLYDLRKHSQIELEGEPFKLGRNDTGLRNFETPLVGREQELAVITSLRTNLQENSGSVVLVAGEGGSGKSRLIRELVRQQSSKELLVLSAKAKLGETVPLGALREAIDGLLARLERTPEDERNRVLSALQAAAGDLAAIIRRLSPGLQKLFKDAQEIAPLDGNAEQERFYLKVAEFFVNLAKIVGPTVLLIDDVQWLDNGSLEILKRLSHQINSAPLLLATTARNDIRSQEALTHFTNSVHGAKLTRIDLGPLDHSAVAALVQALLGGKPLEQTSVIELATKANGNPFAIGEYLRALVDRGILRPIEDRWVIDSVRFHDVKLPEDVIQLLLDRVSTLSTGTAKLLSIAAVIGYEFDIELLTVASSQNRESVNQALFEGQQNSLIEKSHDSFCFVHDRVCEALLKASSEDRLKAVHQQIAEALSRLSWDSPKYLYARARHYFYGDRENHARQVYDSNFIAGTHAVDNFSNEEAAELLGRALQASHTLVLKPAEIGHLYELLGLAFTRVGRQVEAIENLSVALEKLNSPLDQARIYYLLGLARGSGGHYDQARDDFYRALRILGAPFPTSLAKSIISICHHWFAAEFRIRTKFGYGRALGQERDRRKLISKVNSAINYLGYVLGDELLFFHSVIRELHNVQFLGTCTETAKAHVYYSLLMGFSGLKGITEQNSRFAVEMAHQLGDKETIAYCELFQAVATEFHGDVHRGYELMLAAYPRILRYCTAWDKSAAIGHRLHRIVSGKFRENLAFLAEAFPVLEQTGDIGMLHSIYSSLFLSHQVLGNQAEAAKALQAQRKLPEQGGATRMAATFYNLYVTQSCLITEDFGPELERAMEGVEKLGVNQYHTRNRFSVLGFVEVEFVRRAKSEAEKQLHLAALAKMVRKSGFPNSLTALHLSLHYALKGAYLSLLKKTRRAEGCFRKGERLATESDNQWALWLIARERARAAKVAGQNSFARDAAQKALQLASTNGWIPLVRQIEREFGPFENSTPEISTSLMSTKDSSKRGNFGRLLTAERNAEVLLQINLASASSIDPEAQAKAILDELISVLGAERAFLFESRRSQPEELFLRRGRDANQEDLTELKGYSSTVVNSVLREHRPIIVSGTDAGEALGSESIVAHNLRSIMAVPVSFREKFLGVLYLDSTLAKGIFTEADLEIVTALANHIAIGIEGARNTNIELENLTMKKDLEVTTAVQSLILPKNNVLCIDRVKMASFYKAASQSGGDWWWYDYNPARSVFTVFMGDVTGHGAGAAMISAAISGVSHAFRILKGEQRCVPDFLKLLNQTLFDLAGEKYMLSMNAIEINMLTGEVEYWSAGAPPIIVIRGSGEIEEISQLGSWLGSSELGVGHQSCQLKPGDRLALFTDGLYELETAGQRQLGLRRVQKMLLKSRGESVEKATNLLISQALSLQVPSEKEDDISFVLLDYTAAA